VGGKGKGKVHPRTDRKGPEGEERYNSTFSLTSALERSGWSTPRPGRFTPGKENRYPLYKRLGGAQGRSKRVRKISPQPGFDPLTVQLVASRYTDYDEVVELIRWAHEWPLSYSSTRCRGGGERLSERIPLQVFS
jgi:hypothetical protein